MNTAVNTSGTVSVQQVNTPLNTRQNAQRVLGGQKGRVVVPSIISVMNDPSTFGPWFKGKSWDTWRVVLKAIFGLPMGVGEVDVFRRHTGRSGLSGKRVDECWIVAGRRAGKSRVVAFVVTYLAVFMDCAEYLAPGEVATIPVIAADRRQARTIMRYITGFIDAIPWVARMVDRRTKEAISFKTRVTIEIHTASFRSLRGYSLVAVVADEIAFWQSEQTANPDVEIINGLRPGLGTIPGSLLLAISSPWARKGVLWEQYKDYYGKDVPDMLVWQAATREMNPTFPVKRLEREYEKDEAAARAEYGAEFRSDVESFVPLEVVAAASEAFAGVFELGVVSGVDYVAFVDPSGGSQDSFTLAIAHSVENRGVLDLVMEVRPPFSPDEVVCDMAAVCERYKVVMVTGDRYAGEWPRERFRAHGVHYEVSEKPKSQLYRELLPLLMGRKVDLIDSRRLRAQLEALERHTKAGGRDTIDHPPKGHDDVVNAAAGALVLAATAGDSDFDRAMMRWLKG